MYPCQGYPAQNTAISCVRCSPTSPHSHCCARAPSLRPSSLGRGAPRPSRLGVLGVSWGPLLAELHTLVGPARWSARRLGRLLIASKRTRRLATPGFSGALPATPGRLRGPSQPSPCSSPTPPLSSRRSRRRRGCRALPCRNSIFLHIHGELGVVVIFKVFLDFSKHPKPGAHEEDTLFPFG